MGNKNEWEHSRIVHFLHAGFIIKENQALCGVWTSVWFRIPVFKYPFIVIINKESPTFGSSISYRVWRAPTRRDPDSGGPNMSMSKDSPLLLMNTMQCFMSPVVALWEIRTLAASFLCRLQLITSPDIRIGANSTYTVVYYSIPATQNP